MSDKPQVIWAPGKGPRPSRPPQTPLDARYAGLPNHRARKLQTRRERKRLWRKTNRKSFNFHLPWSLQTSHPIVFNRHPPRLPNGGRRASLPAKTSPRLAHERDAPKLAVESEVLDVFCAEDDRKMDEAKKAMSKEAREVVERLEKERNEAMMEQREGRMGFFRVEKWWEDVKGEGSKARRKRLREEARKAGAGGDGEDGGVQLGTGFDSRIDEGDEMETEESKGWETDHDDMPSVLVLRPKRGES